jgi:hypothetical protein
MYKNLVSSAQETHYKDQLKESQLASVDVVEDSVLGHDAASLSNWFSDVSKENSVFGTSGTGYLVTRRNIARNRVTVE